MLLTLLCAALIVYRPYVEFQSLDNPSELHPLVPALVRSWGGDPAIVKVGLQIEDFPEFNVTRNRFIFDGIVWFEFDPSHIAPSIVDKFSFSTGKIITKSEPDIKLIQGKLFVKYDVRVEFITGLNYASFPLDDHRIYIALTNRTVPVQEMILRSSTEGLHVTPGLNFPGWRIVNLQTRSGYSRALLEDFEPSEELLYPKVVFSIDVQRRGIQSMLLIFLPLFLICFIGLFAFSFDPIKSSGAILALSSGSIASLITYRFVIQGISPDVGYFMFSDHIFIIFITFSFIIFAFCMYLVHRQKLSPRLQCIRGIVFLLFHIVFLVSWYYLLNYS